MFFFVRQQALCVLKFGIKKLKQEGLNIDYGGLNKDIVFSGRHAFFPLFAFSLQLQNSMQIKLMF